MFIDTSRVAVTADGEIDHKDVTPDLNVIYIRKKMDFGTSQKVLGAAAKISLKSKGKTSDGDEDSLDIGAYNLALLVHNILAWAGPSFAGVACNRANIERLDPDEPVVGKVLESINNRNLNKQPDPNATSAGDSSSTASR